MELQLNERPKLWAPVEEKYELKKRLGKGSFGEVYKGIDRQTRKRVAIKRMKVTLKGDHNLKRVIREVSLLR